MSDDGTPLWRRSFRALNLTQTLGALNDNLFKGTILLLAAAEAGDPTFADASAFDAIGMEPKALVALVFSLPFVLFGALGGSLADRRSKTVSIRLLKLTEAALMALGAAAFVYGSAGVLLVVLFLMGTQSAFFGPNKYGVMPEILPRAEMARGNAWLQAATYGAIIAGTMLAGEFLALFGPRFAWMGLCCVLVALTGYGVARRMEHVPPAAATRPIVWEPFSGLGRDLRDGAKDKELLIALLLGGLYLHVAGLLVLAIVEYAKGLGFESNAAGATRLTGALLIGILLGSALVHRLSRDGVRPRLASFGLAGVAASIAALGLSFSGPLWPSILLGVAGVCAGLFMVPQRTIVQLRPAAHEKGRFMGTAQMIDFAALILASFVYDALELRLGLTSPQVMWVIGGITAAGGVALFTSSRLYLPPWMQVLATRE